MQPGKGTAERALLSSYPPVLGAYCPHRCSDNRIKGPHLDSSRSAFFERQRFHPRGLQVYLDVCDLCCIVPVLLKTNQSICLYLLCFIIY